jgi:hypothetical protein
MNYLKCKQTLDNIKANEEEIENIIYELGSDIEELFLASSDFDEMNSDLKLFNDNEFELPMELITSKNNDYTIWVLTTTGFLTQLPQTFENPII